MLTLFKRANVSTPAPLGEHDVLVGGGRVLAIARDLQPPVGVATDVVDLGGRRLIPGLVDCHVHATGGGGESGPASRVPPIVLSALTTAGITSVVGVLGY